VSLHEHQQEQAYEEKRELFPENWSNIPFKQIIEELAEIKKRLNELETHVLYSKCETIDR
jgi:hypothetical protein